MLIIAHAGVIRTIKISFTQIFPLKKCLQWKLFLAHVNVLNFKIILIFIGLLHTPLAQANEFWSLEEWMNSTRTPDFEKIKDVKARKKAFFDYLLPEINRKKFKHYRIKK